MPSEDTSEPVRLVSAITSGGSKKLFVAGRSVSMAPLPPLPDIGGPSYAYPTQMCIHVHCDWRPLRLRVEPRRGWGARWLFRSMPDSLAPTGDAFHDDYVAWGAPSPVVRHLLREDVRRHAVAAAVEILVLNRQGLALQYDGVGADRRSEARAQAIAWLVTCLPDRVAAAYDDADRAALANAGYREGAAADATVDAERAAEIQRFDRRW